MVHHRQCRFDPMLGDHLKCLHPVWKALELPLGYERAQGSGAATFPVSVSLVVDRQAIHFLKGQAMARGSRPVWPNLRCLAASLSCSYAGVGILEAEEPRGSFGSNLLQPRVASCAPGGVHIAVPLDSESRTHRSFCQDIPQPHSTTLFSES